MLKYLGMNRKTLPIFLLSALALAACGSSGGGSTPPAPPAPVAPPPPAPEPTFEERLADLAMFDPNPCRAETPGFEALGGWLKNDGRVLSDSRIWMRDNGEIDDTETHAYTVHSVLSDCSVRTGDATARYFNRRIYRSALSLQVVRELGAPARDMLLADSSAPGFCDSYLSGHPEFCTEGPDWKRELRPLDPIYDPDAPEGPKFLRIQSADNQGYRDEESLDAYFDEMVSEGQMNRSAADGWRDLVVKYDYHFPALHWWESGSLRNAISDGLDLLWILVGGYTVQDGEKRIASGSSVCGEAGPSCLFAPWNLAARAGTSISAPQVSAGLDAVLSVWPDMPLRDVRNLAFDCAEYQDPPSGADSSTTTVSSHELAYSGGRTATYRSNEWWGAGAFSLTCLFTPNGGLQDPTTGNLISGGIIGPMAGPVTGASITGVDYTGRDFGYGFARPVARENYALAATANLSASGAISGKYALGHGPGAFRAAAWAAGRTRVDLTVAGDALGLAAQWQAGGLTLRAGVAVQPEGVGSLTGSRAFRAPATMSAAITAAYGRTLAYGFSAHLQTDHWRTLATQARSLWEGADLRESRLTAALLKRAGRHEFALQGVWRSGLSGSLDVDGRSWAVSPQRESGLWLTWTTQL